LLRVTIAPCQVAASVHNLKNESLEVLINPQGAELSSLKFNAQEYLWQGDARYWGGRAPILFPIVGALKDGHMSHNDKQYAMPRHGLARRSRFTLLSQSDNAVTLVLKADSESLQQYPWNFELQVTFALNHSNLTIHYDVLNNDSSDMLFTIGSHPAFALAVDKPSDLESYCVQVEQEESLKRYKLDDAGLLQRTHEAFNSNKIQLSQTLFNEDALVFRDISAGAVSLKHNNKTVLTVDSGGAPHLGIWSKPGAAFVCIEPWLGTSDFKDSDGVFKNKDDLQNLSPGQTFRHSVGVSFP